MKFQQNLVTDWNPTLKNRIFATGFLILLLCGLVRDAWLEPSRFGDRAVIAIFVRLVLITATSLFIVALSLPHSAKRRAVIRHQHKILFILVSWLGLESSCFLFILSPHLGLPWITQSLVIVGFTGITRMVSWVWLLIGSLVQIFFFLLCALVSDRSRDDLTNASVYLVSFFVISLHTAYSAESMLRTLFKHQEISNFVSERQSQALHALAQQAQAAEIKADVVKSQFITNMSHEIRTPLHGVITSLELLKGGGELSAEQQDFIDIASNSAILLSDILSNILTLSNIESGKVTLSREPANVRSIVDSVCAVFANIAAKKGVDVIAHIPPTCPVHVLSDTLYLKQILFNLVSNAIKFTESGHVCVSVAMDAQTETTVSLTLSVSDTGAGVAAEDIHLLFRKFSQVDGSVTRKFQGTGLGLALVSEFSRLFGGSIGLRSDGLGKGSTFSFSATFDKLTECAGTSIEVTRHARMPSGWKCVVLHHSRPVVDVLHSYLEHFGFTPAPADSLSQLLEEHTKLPLCVVLDSTAHEANELLVAHYPSKRRPLLILVLEDPCLPRPELISDLLSGTAEVNWRRVNRRVWAIKKPARLDKLEEVVQEMQDFVILQSNKMLRRLRLRHEGRRRMSVPENVPLGESAFGGSSSGDTSSDESVVTDLRRQSTCSVPTHRTPPRILRRMSAQVAPHRGDFLGFDELSHFRFGSLSNRRVSIAVPDGFEKLSPGFVPSQMLASPAASSLMSSSQVSTDVNFAVAAEISPARGTPVPPERARRAEEFQVKLEGIDIQGTPTNTSQQQSQTHLLTPSSQPDQMATSQPPAVNTESIVIDIQPPDVWKRVLIVDDNSINRKLTERLLSKGGYDCTCVEDGSLAVNIVKQQRFSLIFMDITMPVMDGCTATRLIQEYESERNVEPRTLICALTAADTEKISTANFDGVLKKPVKPTELLDTANRFTSLFRKANTPQ